MEDVLLAIIAIIWLIGAWVRLYKQARFFQIEEYMIGRYLRWWIREQDRFLPKRMIIAVVVGMGLVFVFSEVPDSPLPAILAIIAAIVAVWPPDEGEIKKAFVRTQRATRILGASFAVAIFDLCTYLFIIALLDIESETFRIITFMIMGAVLYLSVPIILSVGSLLMWPVEAFMRRRFLNKAKSVLNRINPTIIGITGSYGKTTTKTFLAHILSGRYKTYPTPKSYNTVMGVCLAINQDMANDYSIETFIVEMGAYVEGEIRRICDLTPPEVSVVVEVGPQHYERFGSIEHVVKAKYEIIEALPKNGTGVFNWDNPYVRGMAEKGHPDNRIMVSRNPSPTVYQDGGPRFVATTISETLDGLAFTVTDHETGQSEHFTAPVSGEHNVTNILLATAVAVQQGMSLRDIAFRVKTLQPAESRLTRTQTASGITIINDAYSANPVGVVGALKTLGLHTGRRVVVTPGMIELGELQEVENRNLGGLIAQYATDVILVGTAQTEPIRQGLKAAGFPAENVQVVEEVREAMTWYEGNLKAGDTVMFLNDLPDTYSVAAK